MADYFVIEEHRRLGPFDAVSILRKIRNRKIMRDTTIALSQDGEEKPAYQFPEFLDVFDEIEELEKKPQQESYVQLSLMHLLKDSGEFFKHNPLASVVTGLFLAVALAGVGALYMVLKGQALIVLGILWTYFLFVLYQISILRKARMQLLTLAFLKMILKQSFVPLLLCSVFISVPVFIIPALLAEALGPAALGLVLLPGTFILLSLFFAPLLIADRDIGAARALKESFRVTWRIGIDNYSVLYMLLMANFIFGAFVFPLLFTLPVTLAAMSEVYDKYFNEY